MFGDKKLVGGDWNHGIWIDFPLVGNVIIPAGFHIFQRGWNQQPVILMGFIVF